MQKEAELVCLEAIAGCPVRVKIRFVVLDKSFHPATGTVDFLVKKLGRSVLDVGDYKTWIGLSFGDFGFVDHLAWTGPRTGLSKQENRRAGPSDFSERAIASSMRGSPSVFSFLLTACE